MNPMADGVILWEGNSELTGDPIAVIATGFKRASSNRKTGAIIQIYILRSDVHPSEALKTGQDEAICGDCPHREGSCYVLVFQGPRSVYETYKSEKYPKASSPTVLSNYNVRFGTYGDPTAVPFEVWEFYSIGVTKWTGYTHQWRTCDPRFSMFLMASADSPEDRYEATSKGWRTFRIRLPSETLLLGEIICPASNEVGKKTTCERCGLCNGRFEGDKRASISIIAHGPIFKVQAYERLRVLN